MLALLIGEIASNIKGGGGGKPTMAQAGGKDAEGMDAASMRHVPISICRNDCEAAAFSSVAAFFALRRIYVEAADVEGSHANGPLRQRTP